MHEGGGGGEKSSYYDRSGIRGQKRMDKFDATTFNFSYFADLLAK